MACSSFTSSAVASILFVACLLLSQVQAQCNFAASCADENLSGTTFTASCASVAGDSVTSSLDLNDDISNNDGQLACPGGDFGATCSNIGLSGGHELVANCLTPGGDLVQTSLDLNTCIANNNGDLQFCV